MANKATRAEAQKRTRIILEMLLQSTATVDILRYGVENWGLTERGVETYITAAYVIIDKMANVNNEQSFANNLAQRQYLKSKAIKEGDLRLAHEIVKDEAKIRNLYPAEKHEHTGEIIQQVKIDVSDLTDSELDAITNLAARLGNTKTGTEAA